MIQKIVNLFFIEVFGLHGPGLCRETEFNEPEGTLVLYPVNKTVSQEIFMRLPLLRKKFQEKKISIQKVLILSKNRVR